MKKTTNKIIYVLRFVDFPLIKIGKTTSFVRRLNAFRKEYKAEFDLQNSMAVGCHSASKLDALETDLLANTIEFALQDDLRKRFYGLDGFNEIRHESCLPLVTKMIRHKERLTGEFLVHTGISLEKYVKAELPPAIFDSNGETEYLSVDVSQELLKAIKASDPAFEEMDYGEMVNGILGKLVKANKVKLDIKEGKKYHRKKILFYANKYGAKKWHWNNPNSKLGDFMEDSEKEETENSRLPQSVKDKGDNLWL